MKLTMTLTALLLTSTTAMASDCYMSPIPNTNAFQRAPQGCAPDRVYGVPTVVLSQAPEVDDSDPEVDDSDPEVDDSDPEVDDSDPEVDDLDDGRGI